MSAYPKGKQPLCPDCRREPIRHRGSQRCKRCTAKPGWHVASLAVSGETAEVDRTTSERVRTLKDLIRVCEIDTTEWDIERWTANKWEMGYKDSDDQSAHTIPLFQVKAWLRRKSPVIRTLDALRVELVADIKREAKALRPVNRKSRFVDGDWLFEFAPTDLHVGKLTWGEETVTNYDAAIASDLFLEALDFLLDKALRLSGGKLSRVLCLFGNDVSHIDSKKGQTTAGTPMDVDTRYIKIYRRICELHRHAMRRLLDVAPVDVVIVPGNHDELTSFHLGEVLAATFESNPHIKVDNSPRLRKYYEFGVNLLGFTHGDKERIAELPLTMAREQPEAWARCSSREFHIGHLHKKEQWETGRPGLVVQGLYSDKGVRIRRFASLSAHDAWHTSMGYMDRRTCEGLIFHKRAGFTADVSFNLDHLTGRPMKETA